MTIGQRIRARVECARRFSGFGLRFRDRVKLATVGLARLRPFGGKSFYGKITRHFSQVDARIRSNQGLILSFDLTDLVDSMIFEELVIERIYPLERIPFEPDLVIDAGSCRGLFSLLARDRFPAASSVCIEPQKNNVARIRAALDQNFLDAELLVGAVAVGKTSVQFSGDGFGGMIVEDQQDSITVPAVDLHKLIKRRSPERLLLKMDIEGAEAEALPSIIDCLPESCAIFLETHHSRTDSECYLECLESVGFRRTEIRSRSVEDQGIEYIEWIFIRDTTIQ